VTLQPGPRIADQGTPRQDAGGSTKESIVMRLFRKNPRHARLTDIRRRDIGLTPHDVPTECRNYRPGPVRPFA